MSENQSEIEPPAFDSVVPDDFFEHEGDGEFDDPALMEESPHDDIRSAWGDWHCKKGPGKFVDVKFFGKGVNGVPAPAYDAYKALEQALQSAGYAPSSSGSFNCRHIGNNPNKPWSLHAYGIAIDIDPKQNPFTKGDPYSGKFQKSHVDAVLSIKNTSGRTVWEWGGSWRTPDRMHFQLDQGPSGVGIDWSTVPGADPVELPGVTHRVTASTLNMRGTPTTSAEVIASLPNGAQAAAQPDAAQESDGYRWIRVQAAYGGRVVDGWVASQYVEAVGPATSARPAAGARLEGATHRVAATGLNLREQPTTSGTMIIELSDGTEVAIQTDAPQESDGFEWVKVRALIGEQVKDGWVASKYLEPTT